MAAASTAGAAAAAAAAAPTHTATTLDRLTVHGPTLAALLGSALAAERCCDGLLFGRVTVTRSLRADDHADAVAAEERTALVAGGLAGAATGSWHDGVGAVDTSALERLRARCAAGAPSEPLLGWFSYRPGTASAPSLREAAITASLAAEQQQLGGLAGGGGSSSSSGSGGGAPSPTGMAVFLLVTSSASHNGATLSLHCRAFVASAAAAAAAGGDKAVAAGCLVPVDLAVLNLGGGTLGALHGSGSVALHAPPFTAPALAGALATAPLPGAVEKRLRDAAGGAASEAAEAVCGALLAGLREAAGKAGAAGDAVAALRERNANLLDRIAALEGALADDDEGYGCAGAGGGGGGH